MSLLRRMILMNQGSSTPPEPVLPYDAEVEYLETNGNQYINTQIYGTMDLDFNIKFIPTILPTATGSDVAGTIFGTRTAWNSKLFQVTTFTRTNTSSIGTFSWANLAWNSSSNKRLGLVLNQVNILSKNGTTFTDAQGNSSTMNTYTFTTDNPIYLFCLKQGNSLYEKSKGLRFISADFSRNGVKIADYVPVIKDGRGCLYDKVSNAVFYSEGDDFVLP